jgi:hypothetical protein
MGKTPPPIFWLADSLWHMSIPANSFRYKTSFSLSHGDGYVCPRDKANSTLASHHINRMSFGFSVGDFLAVIELANKLRKNFVEAPIQFKAISEDVRQLSIVLGDIEIQSSLYSEDELARLKPVVQGCEALLRSLEATLSKYADIQTSGKEKLVKRVWKKLRLEPEDIRDIRTSMTVRLQTLDGIRNQITGTNVRSLVIHQQDEERDAILKWITAVDHAAKQNDCIRRRQPGSRKWLFESAEYGMWLRGEVPTLFCPGIPGAGKTTTLAVVIEQLQGYFAKDPTVLIGYHYCSYQHQGQYLEHLLGGLLRTSLEHHNTIPESIRSLYARYKRTSKTLHKVEILEILDNIFSNYSRVYLLVDALDEVVPPSNRTLFITTLFDFQSTRPISILLTSRAHIADIQRPLDNHGALEVEIKASDDDVQRFLSDNMYRLPSFVARKPELQERIIRLIPAVSSGM